jgi:hypothetical protein
MTSFLLLLLVAIASSQETVLYQNAGPISSLSEDLLTHVQMSDNMFIKMDIEINAMATADDQAWGTVFFMGDSMARVPDIWLWNAATYPQYIDGFAVHFSRSGSGRLYWSLEGSGIDLQINTVYTLEVCYDQTVFTSRTSGGAINGEWVISAGKYEHDNVEEPVYAGYPNNGLDSDTTITNLVIGTGADCTSPVDIPTADMCCINVGRFRKKRKERKWDKKCSRKSDEDTCEAESNCEWSECESVVVDQEGEYWLAIDDKEFINMNTKYDESLLVSLYHNNPMYQMNFNIWWYTVCGIVVIIIGIYMLYKNRYKLFSEYKHLDGPDSITPLLHGNKV